MLNVTRDKKDKTLILRLSGEIDETVNFDQAIGATSPDTVLHCEGISRINSLGVKAWIAFFEACTKRGVKLRYTHCSPAVVEQLGLIRNFACEGVIETIYVPFVCTNKACCRELVGLFKVEDLQRIAFKIPALKCSTCGSPAVFDDLEDEYFRFALKRS